MLGTREGGCEAPLLFVLFIADLIEHLEKVQLSSDPVFLASRLIRALLLADDLALFAHSEEDLQALLDAWAVYCDRHHFETQVAKTEIVVFTYEGDNFRPSQGYAKEIVFKQTGEESCDI